MKNIFFLTAIAIQILFVSCNADKHDEHKEESADHEEEEMPNTTTLSAAQMNSIKIEIGGIEKKQLTASLKANGLLRVPNNNRANATAFLGGVINSILVQTGSTVNKGQVLATITNSAFIIMQEEYLSISSQAALAQLDLERQKELQVGNANALKNLQSAESALTILTAKKASLQKQLALIGINTANLTAENMQSVVNIVSPISGAISNIMVNIGGYVDANKPIAEIVDNSQLHLDLYVYEKDLQKIKVGQTIHFTLTNNPGKEYDADVYAISNTFEENTKAVAVHGLVKGDKNGLIDGMSITALVSLENATVDAVPTNAIVSNEGQDYIFIIVEDHAEEITSEPSSHAHVDHDHAHTEHENDDQHAEETTFEKIPVRKGTTDVGYSEITLLKDIPANSKVVVNGGFFILAKMNNKGEGHVH